MFKLESYITPILLSYVDKYIKNFKPEDSQLSLWGGEASFHNLDLRLEVLEDELQLPFSFVSGHIHELIIHVPWTKLNSEPICVTINTIECILKLRGGDLPCPDSSVVGSTSRDRRKRTNKSSDVAAPPGYVQTLVNRVVSNITINCCNLIVKYVEEDIVMSMNVKNFMFQSANDKWEPEYTDLSSSQLMRRKVISLTDVTLCLDKRNASGKIDSYQEPVLYRCSMSMRLLRNYDSMSAAQASSTRLDIHCGRMTFNISETQVPMMMRLMLLARALLNREVGLQSVDFDGHMEVEEGEDNGDAFVGRESWAGWGWWWQVPAVLLGWGAEGIESETQSEGYTLHFGVYIDDLTFNFRVGDSCSSERSTWKNKVEPFLSVTLRGCMLDSVNHNTTWVNSQLGICCIQVEPVGPCDCHALDCSMEKKAIYFESGSYNENYSSDSLFSTSAVENRGERRRYNLSWDSHQATVSETNLLEKTPALAIDYLYMIELPEDFGVEKIVEFNGDLEYSNLPERALCRFVMGPFVIRINSGILHRFQRIHNAGAVYDYQPYGAPLQEDRRDLLPTVTSEEYDNLEGTIPLRTYQFTCFQPKVEFQGVNHVDTSASKMSCPPAVCVDTRCIDARLTEPMYPRRLVRAACLLPSLPAHMFHACHSHTIIKVLGITSHLTSSVDSYKILTIENISFKVKDLLLNHLWDGPELLHKDSTLDAGSITLTATTAQLYLIQEILTSLFSKSNLDHAINTCLLMDIFSLDGKVVLEATGSNIIWHKGLTKSTSIDTLTIVECQSTLIMVSQGNRDARTLIFSGPFANSVKENVSSDPFIKAVIQWPRDIEGQTHAPALVIDVREAFCSLDPLVCAWLHYSPAGVTEVSRRDRAPPCAQSSAPGSVQYLSDWLVLWHPVWQGLVVHIEVARWLLQVPRHPADSVCIQLPVIVVCNATSKGTLTSNVPAHFPPSIWTPGNSNFPWNMSLSDLSVWSIINEKQQYLLKPVTTKCTIGISTRFASTRKDHLTSLGLCVHNDTGALHMSLNRAQAELLSGALLSIAVVARSLFGAAPAAAVAAPRSPAAASESASASASGLFATESVESVGEGESVRLSAWLQWTVARVSASLYQAGHLKLAVEVEDLMASLDLQLVYSKMKLKVAAANIQPYSRSEGDTEWRVSPSSGLIVRGCDGSGLLTATLTRAKRRSVHRRWGAHSKESSQLHFSDSSFISEVLVQLQPLDISLSLETLTEWVWVVQPLSPLLGIAATPTSSLPSVCSNSLPLLYLDLMAVRFSVPFKGSVGHHDTLIVQIDSAVLSPHAENPLWRSPARPDVYHMAEQAHILSVPGSEVEDRQYELTVAGLAVSTGLWQNIESCRRMSASPASSLRTMSENPALVWNSLEPDGAPPAPEPRLMEVLAPLSVRIVAAPAIVYRNKILVCGHALEINAVSDVNITLTSSQLRLATALVAESHSVGKNLLSKPVEVQPPVSSYVTSLAEEQQRRLRVRVGEEGAADSGIDTADLSSCETPLSSRPRGSRRVARPQRPLESVHGASHRTAATATTTTTTTTACSRSRERESSSPEVTCARDTPFDCLVTARTASLMLCHDLVSDGKDEDHHRSADNHHVSPLVFISVAQPHVLFSHIIRSCSLQASVYNAVVKLGSSREGVQDRAHFTDLDFPLVLFESRKGVPDPRSGIPPALVTVHLSLTAGKPAQVSVTCGRPAKLTLSMVNILHIQHSADVVFSCITSRAQETSPPKQASGLSRSFSLKIACEQLVVALQAMDCEQVESLLEVSVSSMRAEVCCARQDRVACGVEWDGLAATCRYALARRLLLQPCDGTLRLNLQWPSWVPPSLRLALPHIQLGVRSDCVRCSVSPDHLRSVSNLIDAYRPLFDRPTAVSSAGDLAFGETVSDGSEQLYADDLRAGAFQFADVSDSLERGELPLPYQCVFWESAPPAIAWRYPQPRAIAGLRVLPVPFQGGESGAVVCSLQYWSDCRAAYQPVATFLLSESHESALELQPDRRAVSAAWRVLLVGAQGAELHAGNSDEIPAVSPRALAACMRVDSFFSASMAANLEIAIDIAMFEISLVNEVSNAAYPMPHPLQEYCLDGKVPDTHNFISIFLNHMVIFHSIWPDGHKIVDVSCVSECKVLDYATLTQRNVIEPFLQRLSLSWTIDSSVDVSFLSKGIAFYLSPSTAHTLAVSARLWEQELYVKDSKKVQVLFSQYVLCNDTVFPIRLGQVGTQESVLLLSKQCHLYAWRSIVKKTVLHLSVTEPSVLVEGNPIWSSPFSPDTLGTQVCKICAPGGKEVVLFVKVVALSDAQRQVSVSGQLVISNGLGEMLDVALPGLPPWRKAVPLPPPPSAAPTIVLVRSADDPRLSIRLRMHKAERNSWSGDIPLLENPKSNKPWLVKVPLQDKGEFICVWCRVFHQNMQGSLKILVLLSPLHALSSLLPAPVSVRLALSSDRSLHMELPGQGALALLNSPGALRENTIQVHVDLDSETKCFPLGHSLVDHRQLFQNVDPVDIDSVLESVNKSSTVEWPVAELELRCIQWSGVDVPGALLQASYRTLSPYSGTVLLELRPVALLLNVLESAVCVEHRNGVFNIPSRCAAALPKLEDTFRIGVRSSNDAKWHFSDALQLAREDGGKSFYMPRIVGLIPVEGHVQISVKCESSVYLLTLGSQLHRDMRVLTTRASYIVSNSSRVPLRVTAIAVRHRANRGRLPVPRPDCCEAVTVCPDSKNSGYPLERWLHVKSCEAEVVPYLSVSLPDGESGSCPLRLCGCPSRRRFTVPLRDMRGLCTRSLVLCVVECGGQTFLNIADEPHADIVLHNSCDFRILFASKLQPNREADIWDWQNAVEPRCAVQYSTLVADEAFPNIAQAAPGMSLLLAVDSVATNTVAWSSEIQLDGSREQFISLPGHGDVKVHLWSECFTTHVLVEGVSRIEISARDVRSRLVTVPVTLPATGKLQSGLPVSSLEVVVPLHALDDSCEKTDIDAGGDQTIEQKEKSGMSLRLTAFFEFLSWTFCTPSSPCEEVDVFSVTLDHVSFTSRPVVSVPSQSQFSDISFKITVGDLQLDNHFFESGEFDFPVVLMGQEDYMYSETDVCFSVSASELVEKYSSNALLALNLSFEYGFGHIVPTTLHVSVGPLTAYIEDTFLIQLKRHAAALFSPFLTLREPSDAYSGSSQSEAWVPAPLAVRLEWQVLGSPLRLVSLTVDPVWLLLSVHSSTRVYIALDRSPLQFTQFCRRSLFTTSYNLGHALTMHYATGALFGAGWVVSSLELLGSPGGFARTLGTGLRDFVSLPCRGILQGPWAFLVGVTHGSASLMKHFTAGTLTSVSKMASSVARNLDRLALDEEHLQRAEAMRRTRPGGAAEGLARGLAGLGVSMLGAVGGLAHHPLESLFAGRPSPRGLVSGVGRGLVGILTKPLSGAADLVAMTGQGLLQGAGWTNLPQLRRPSRCERASGRRCTTIKHSFKIQPCAASQCLAVLEATSESSGSQFKAVTLVLTVEKLIVLCADCDTIEAQFPLMEILPPESDQDPSMFTINFKSPPPKIDQRMWDFVNGCHYVFNAGPPALENYDEFRPVSSTPPLTLQPIDHQSTTEVEDMNPNLKLSCSSSDDGELSLSTEQPVENATTTTTQPGLVFHVNPQSRSHFLALVRIALSQLHEQGFQVL